MKKDPRVGMVCFLIAFALSLVGAIAIGGVLRYLAALCFLAAAILAWNDWRRRRKSKKRLPCCLRAAKKDRFSFETVLFTFEGNGKHALRQVNSLFQARKDGWRCPAG